MRASVAVVGATGAVGRTMLEVLEERDFPVDSLKLLASSRSAGRKIKFRGEAHEVEELTENSFGGVQVALFSIPSSESKRYAPAAAKAGAVVVDNSNAFRMEPDVPLVVPEVNAHAIKTHSGIIANPNCSTIQLVVALKPLHDAARIRRVVLTTFQSVSGTGQEAVDELRDLSRAALESRESAPKVYPYSIAFNCIPEIPNSKGWDVNGYTEEEMKAVNETRKIMEDGSIRVTATCVRVPVFVGHSESVNVETERKLTAAEAREILSEAPGVEVVDTGEPGVYPMPLEAAGRDETFVGRIREDGTIENGLNLWVVSDNLRKGAATNAVQIAEYLV